MNMEQLVEWKLAVEAEKVEETPSTTILCTTNPTWSGLGSNPGQYNGHLATNCMNCGMTDEFTVLHVLLKQ
jgi:hypothetical protein